MWTLQPVLVSPQSFKFAPSLGPLFKRTGSRNPKLIGLDNSLLNEGIPETAGSSHRPEALHQLVGSTREQDQPHLSQLFYRILGWTVVRTSRSVDPTSWKIAIFWQISVRQR